ncbi:MAG TPA: C25 family cysteine peptidase [Herpetosiphonaceae bacterium]
MQHIHLFLLFIIGVALSSPSAHRIAQPAAPQLQIRQDAAGVRVTVAGDTAATWPTVAIGGIEIPAQLLVVNTAHNTPAPPAITGLDCRPWAGQLKPAPRPIPEANGQARPDLAPAQATTIPTTPITVLRAGRSRGQPIRVLAVAAIIERTGQLCQLTRLDATIPGARLIDEAPPASVTEERLANAPAPNPAASRKALTIRVREAGMQRISGTYLAHLGASRIGFDPAQLQLHHAGQEIALQLLDAEDGRIDAGDELRFYAPDPGDRWNQAATYWLTVEDAPGRRIARRDSGPSPAPQRTTGAEAEIWQPRTSYDSTLPGPDGDHWFADTLRSGPEQEIAPLTLPLTPTLPLAAGSVTLTIAGSAATAGPHQLEVTAGSTMASARWEGTGDWSQTITLDTAATTATIALRPAAAADQVLLDQVQWTRPITLDIGIEGATFQGEAGSWRYQLGDLRDDQALYDVTDPAQPIAIALHGGGVEAGPEAQRYLVTGSRTLHTPEVQRHQPIDRVTPREADAVYVAPAAFHAALAPLLAHRRAQGYVVELIDVAEIYDLWSFGEVDPAAIRRFMQHAAATWPRAPEALVLVGDGTSDPHNYLGRTNANHIPPYLALVDPWLGETACEPCFGQLDGDDPLDDALPDLAVGRLPVKTEAELVQLVQKLIRYDTAPAGGSWRGKAVFVADNADGAGDFASFAELSAAEQPAGIAVERVYYQPSLDAQPVSGSIADARAARARTLAALNQGAGLVNYIGHSHAWQWAVTDPTMTPSYLLGLYDVDALANGEKLPIVLEMTCLTSAFQQPAYSGTTIDERLVLHPHGGAIATWGPTGLGIAHGHDALQRGFYRALWSTPAGTATLGELTLAGYRELFTRGSCCQDTLRTFALLGDPLTRARVQPLSRVWVPQVGR